MPGLAWQGLEHNTQNGVGDWRQHPNTIISQDSDRDNWREKQLIDLLLHEQNHLYDIPADVYCVKKYLFWIKQRKTLFIFCGSDRGSKVTI